MKEFIKKRNLGLIFGAIMVIIAFLFCSIQMFENKNLNKKADNTLNDYIDEINEVCVSIDIDHSEEKRKEILAIIDKYWADADEEDGSFADKKTSQTTKDELVKKINEMFDKGDCAYLSYYESDVECSDAYKFKSKSFDVECITTSNLSVSNNNKLMTTVSMTGVNPVSEIENTHTVYTFKKIKGEWKIVGFRNVDNELYHL